MSLEPLTQEQIRNFVLPAHGNLEVVKQLLAEEPRLLNEKYQEFDETANFQNQTALDIAELREDEELMALLA